MVKPEQKFAHLDLVQEAVLILKRSREVIFANRPAIRQFGRPRLGLDIVHLTRNPQCIDAINTVLATGEPVQKAVVFGDPANGPFDVRVSPFKDAADGQHYVLVSLRDINEMLLAQEMRSDFVANVSHELRSPLSSISGFIETLKGPAKDDAGARSRFLGLMEQEVARMARLITDLLSLSKVQANKQTVPGERIDITALAVQVMNTLGTAAAEQGKTISLDTEDGIGLIPGNSDELIQVLSNLLENAIKYSARESTITLSLSKQQHVAGMSGPVIAIRVTDQGEGIAPHHLPRLTERFYRADSHRARDQGGTGLGLAIVKHIILHHRGRLKIESTEGKGSIFTVFLPV